MADSVEPCDYASLAYWSCELQEAYRNSDCACISEILDTSDITTREGIRETAEGAIRALQNNRELTAQQAMNLWQYSQCLKKFRYGCDASPEEMFRDWVLRNKECSAPLEQPSWLLAEVARLLAPLGPVWDTIEDQGRFGNGAVYEGHTSIARWNAARSFPYNVRDPDDLWQWARRPSDANCCRLCCVPKDMFKLRSITVEPAEATFLQQYNRRRLLKAANAVLPFSSAIPQQLYGGGPEVQRQRALLASQTGKLATIDLSNASDCVRWDVVSRVFPANIVAALERSRTPYVDVAGTRYAVHMYAGMGNATTFAVESLYFWALVTALSHWLRDFTPVSVFGDDIVCSTTVANHPLFQEQLAKAGLVLNMAKSGLSTGPGFREACGLVAYCGHELPLLRVQGYRTEQPVELVSLCSLLSSALASDSRYAPFVKDLAIRVGRRLVCEYKLPVVPLPLVEAGAYVVDGSERIGNWSYRTRWDPLLQHPQVKVRVLHRRPGKTVTSRDLTRMEALGILNGQLHTQFHDKPAGYRCGPRTVLECTTREDTYEFRGRWVACWGSDCELDGLTA